MTPLEICLLIVGIIFILGSFILTDKNMDKKTEEVNVELTTAQKQKLQFQVDDIIDSSLYTAVERTEVELDKISNLKMTELSEYSETVIQDINKNHNEVMFLYNMLGDKEKELKSMLAEIEGVKQRIQDLKEHENADSEKADNQKEDAETIVDRKIQELKNELDTYLMSAVSEAAATVAETITARPVKKETTRKRSTTKSSTQKKTEKASATAQVEEKKKAEEVKEPEIIEETAKTQVEFEAGANNNEQILKLHNEGKSNIEIAKELGLGMGEVKLVIDLFRGGKR